MTNLIKHFRKKKGWSGDRLAKEIGTTPQQINHLENGKRRLTVDWMRKIATALGLSHPGVLIPDNAVEDREYEMLTMFRQLGPVDQDRFIGMLASFTGTTSLPPPPKAAREKKGAHTNTRSTRARA